jgi:hypothetical protein
VIDSEADTFQQSSARKSVSAGWRWRGIHDVSRSREAAQDLVRDEQGVARSIAKIRVNDQRSRSRLAWSWQNHDPGMSADGDERIEGIDDLKIVAAGSAISG